MNFTDNTYIKAEGVYYAGIIKDVNKHRNPLQPLFEAFTNSLESIRSDKSANGNGFIKIKLYSTSGFFNEGDFYKAVIEDSGVGFNDAEFTRFVTYKDNRKGYNNKGSGRLQLLHYFNNCEYTSVYKDGNGFKERRFRLSKAKVFLENNAITFLETTKPIDATASLTTLSLSVLSNDKDKLFYSISLEEMKEKFIAHYIQYFCSHRDALPAITFEAYTDNNITSETSIVSDDIPEIDNTKNFISNYNALSADGKHVVETTRFETFTIKAFRIPKDKLEKNSIKLTSKDELVESNEFKINLHSLSSDDNIGNDRFLFLISSPFLNERDDEMRGELKLARRDNFKKEISLFNDEEIFIEDIEDKANDNIVAMYDEIKRKNEEKQMRVEELQSMFLLNPDVLRDLSITLNDSEERILEKVYTAESKLIAKGDFEIKKQIDELKSLNPASADYEKEFNEAVKKLVKEIPLQNRAALTHYVARRKLVLDLFDKILHKKLNIQKDGRNIDEKLLHNLIFKQYCNRPDASDLWLVNEDFILFRGTSESKLKDIKIDNVKVLKETLSTEELQYRDSLDEDRYEKRPDILLFPDEGKCIIIEFKAPDVNVSEHINQINRYASLILNLSKDEFRFDTFYGYLVGEKINPDDVRDFDADFKNAPHFNYVFRASKAIAGKFGRADGSLYMEVIQYSVLHERAKRRNDIFIEKLYENKDEGYDDDRDDLPF